MAAMIPDPAASFVTNTATAPVTRQVTQAGPIRAQMDLALGESLLGSRFCFGGATKAA
ncbi:MAG: hypothetical protein ABSE77_11820 [Acidimicrobiales bacterium]